MGEYDKIMLETLKSYVDDIPKSRNEDDVQRDLESILVIVREWLHYLRNVYE